MDLEKLPIPAWQWHICIWILGWKGQYPHPDPAVPDNVTQCSPINKNGDFLLLSGEHLWGQRPVWIGMPAHKVKGKTAAP